MNRAQWNSKRSSVRRNDGLIVRIAMQVAVALNRPTRSFGRPRATGCASSADCGNQIVLLHRINKRSTRFVARWTWSAVCRLLRSQPFDKASGCSSSTPACDHAPSSRSLRAAGQAALDTPRHPLHSPPTAHVLPLWRGDGLDKGGNSSLDSRSTRLSTRSQTCINPAFSQAWRMFTPYQIFFKSSAWQFTTVSMPSSRWIRLCFAPLYLFLAS